MIELNKFYIGDCLIGLAKIPDKSINLIVIDPPYNIGKAEWDKIDNYVEWIGKVFKECERVLKDNGSFYWFHNDFEQMAELQLWLKENTKFMFKSLITIDKTDNSFVKDLYGSQNHFRNFLNLSEYCLFYTFQNDTGLKKVMGDYNNFSTLKEYFINEKNRIESELGIKLKDKIKWTTHFHWFAQGQSWGMCSEERYKELKSIFPNYFQKPYELLHQEYIKLRTEYEKERYIFNAKDGVENVWRHSFKEDKKTKHPTQKPVKLLEDIIKFSSNEGDIILDCFMGSGTTAIACINLNRNYIGFEWCPEKPHDKYYEIAKNRINQHIIDNKLQDKYELIM